MLKKSSLYWPKSLLDHIKERKAMLRSLSPEGDQFCKLQDRTNLQEVAECLNLKKQEDLSSVPNLR